MPDPDPGKYNYTWRATCAQVVVIVAFHTMMVNVGLILAMPSVIIGALQNGTAPARATADAVGEGEGERMAFTVGQASWFGSLLFVVQPLGSVASGALQDRLGRKRCLLLVNACQVLAWLVMCHATTVDHLFIGLIILGLTIGFEEAPVLSYLGEVTEPRLRGLASSSGGIFFNLGLILETGLGYAYSYRWRAMLKVAALTPVVAFLALSLVPESPTWLVARGRTRDAGRAYRWLRGWVPAARVQRELDDAVAYVHRSRTTAAGRKKESRLSVFLGPSVRRPLLLIVSLFFISCCVSLGPLRPFIVPILQRLHSPIDAFEANMYGSVLSLLGSLTACVALPLVGKRRLTFASLAVCVAGCICLSLCLAAPRFDGKPRPDLVLLLMGLVTYSSTCGIVPVPWILISELFPLRAKGVASGACAALGYLVMFALTGSYQWLVATLSDWGALLAYAAVGLPGALYLFLRMPETEGVPLEVAERLMDKKQRLKPPEVEVVAEVMASKTNGLLDKAGREGS